MTSFYWYCEAGDQVVGSGWAKSMNDAHAKAAAAISLAPDWAFSEPTHRTTIEITKKND